MKKIFTAVIISLFMASSFAQAEPKREVKKGNLLYNKGKFQDALKEYEKAFLGSPDSDIVNFDLGAALYKTADYKAAMGHFEKSLVTNDEPLEQKANYNLGNAEYKYGIGREKEDLKGAIDLLKKALKHYERAISLDPEDADAKYNYEFVKKELERLEKKIEEQRKREEKKEEKPKEGEKEAEKPEPKPEDKKEDKKEEDRKEDKKEEDKREEEKKDEKREEEKKEKEKEEEEKKEEREEEREKPSGQTEDREEKPKEMSEEEAAMLLKNYRDEEEPKGLYREPVPTHGLPEVLKDW